MSFCSSGWLCASFRRSPSDIQEEKTPVGKINYEYGEKTLKQYLHSNTRLMGAISSLLYCGIIIAICAPLSASADSFSDLPSNECQTTASGDIPTSPCHEVTDTSKFQGARSEPSSALATSPIDLPNDPTNPASKACRYVDNISTRSIFIPFNSALEWGSFITNYPQSIANLVYCARPAVANITPAIITPTCAPDETHTSETVNLPYQRINTTYSPNPYVATFSCKAAGPGLPNTLGSISSVFTAAYKSPDTTFTPPLAPNDRVSGWTESRTPGTGGCGPAAGVLTSSNAPPANSDLCINSTAGPTPPATTFPANTGAYWVWSCKMTQGTTYKASTQCTAPITAVCGPDGGSGSLTVLASNDPNLCNPGFLVSNFTSNAHSWSWTCSSPCGCTVKNCSANNSGAQCGSDNNAMLANLSNNDANLCSNGATVSNFVTQTTSWTWTCNGANSTTAQCSTETIVNGQCGADSGQDLSSTPTSLCKTGTASLVSGSGPWNWTCTGANGGTTASCSAQLTVNGQCGADNGQDLTSTPASLCKSGTASSVSGSGPWTWSCNGAYDGSTASCSAQLLVNGQCGADNSQDLSSTPTHLCNSGTASSVSGSGPWNWSCTGANGGTTAQCSSQLLVNGQCGADNAKNLSSTPVNLCTSGTATSVSGSGPWTWSCTGSNGGSTASCSAQKFVNGQCGSDNNQDLSSTPTHLCNSGTASGVSGSGPWTWSCTGSNGGATASCSALLIVNGQCGSDSGQNLSSTPTHLCNSGTASGVSGSGPWSWSCSGANSGSSPTCTANLIVNGQCGSSAGNVNSKPTTNLCTSGTPTSVSGSGPWTWTCTGANSGSSPTCTANLSVNGTCGSDNGKTLSSTPTNLCSSGMSSSFQTASNGSGWSWSCNGANGGSTASCAASGQCFCPPGNGGGAGASVQSCSISNNVSTCMGSGCPCTSNNSGAICTSVNNVYTCIVNSGNLHQTMTCQGFPGGCGGGGRGGNSTVSD
jgi:hypothetical protein